MFSRSVRNRYAGDVEAYVVICIAKLRKTIHNLEVGKIILGIFTLRNRVIGSGLLLLLLVTGCGMPPEFQVRKGQDPEYQDDEVRFRTTYYFRVFNQCLPRDQYGTAVNPRIDSIFRFTLTGKANALFSKVHFESGTLEASQVDPYGKPETAMQNQAGNASGLVRAGVGSTDAATPPAASPSETDPGKRDTICSKDATPRRGFQLWGPQGWRNFNPNERLVMAMSSSAEPLIAQLQKVARLQESARSSGFEVDLMLSRQDNRNHAARLALKNCDEKNLSACLQDIIDAYRSAGAGAAP